MSLPYGREKIRDVLVECVRLSGLRDVGSVSVPRLVVTVLCCALVPLAVSVPSLVTLAILAGLLCALAAFETVRSREFRRELRAR
jgi:hypothetical protein